MIEQYNNYSINNITVNGIATQVREEREREVTSQEPLLATVTLKTTGREVYVRIYLFL